MAVVGDTKVRFNRSYVYLNPDTSASTPDNQRPGVWRLASDESSDDPTPGPAPEGTLGFQTTVKEAGGIVVGQLVVVDQNGATLAQADSYSTAVVAGVALTAGSLDDVITVTRNETIDFYDVANLVDGGGSGGFLATGTNYYLSSTTAGNWTDTPDVSTAGAVVIQVGTAVGPNSMSIEIQQPLVI